MFPAGSVALRRRPCRAPAGPERGGAGSGTKRSCSSTLPSSLTLRATMALLLLRADRSARLRQFRASAACSRVAHSGCRSAARQSLIASGACAHRRPHLAVPHRCPGPATTDLRYLARFFLVERNLRVTPMASDRFRTRPEALVLAAGLSHIRSISRPSSRQTLERTVASPVAGSGALVKHAVTLDVVAVRGRYLLPCLGLFRGTELVGHRGDHDTGLVEQSAFNPVVAVAV